MLNTTLSQSSSSPTSAYPALVLSSASISPLWSHHVLWLQGLTEFPACSWGSGMDLMRTRTHSCRSCSLPLGASVGYLWSVFSWIRIFVFQPLGWGFAVRSNSRIWKLAWFWSFLCKACQEDRIHHRYGLAGSQGLLDGFCSLSFRWRIWMSVKAVYARRCSSYSRTFMSWSPWVFRAAIGPFCWDRGCSPWLIVL